MPDAAGPEFAVLNPIIGLGGEERVLLTCRPASLPQYAGQVAFPGGAREPGDRDLRATALREAFEEVGIPPERVDLVAELEWFQTTLGHRVKPFAGRIVGGFEAIPNPMEVERIILLPVEVIRRDPFSLRGRFRDREGKSHPTYTFTYEGAEIWGLTARILRRYFLEDPGAGASGSAIIT